MSSTDWESKYLAQDTPWDKGEPSPGLVDFLQSHPKLEKGNVCVPGCGTGHDVLAWARRGFAVTGYDIAPSAAKLACERLAVEGAPGEVRLGDFLSDMPPTQFDWVFEHTLFCAIDPSQRNDYVKAVLRWLKPQGYYLAVNYFIPDQDGPPFGTDRDEIWQRFSPYFELLEEWVPRSYPNSTGLERMFWWRKK